MTMTVLDFKSRWSRFIGLQKFKKEHPNVQVIKKWSIVYGGFGTELHTVYFAKIEY
ncbi:MAG: hypothetical protein HFJ34_05135 [Clostridia bacterium]|nr:hypothetical protein [Clostridia bacterium]